MAQEKTFDKAELIKFYDDGGDHPDKAAEVGTFTVITPGDLYGPKREVFPVLAITRGLHCERYGFAVVLRTVAFPLGGDHHLDKYHPLRSVDRVDPHIEYGARSAAQLVRLAVGIADDWRETVKDWLPAESIDLRGFETEDTAQTGTTIDDILEGGE